MKKSDRQTVCVVTSGEYEDYRIRGIYTTQQAAKQAAYTICGRVETHKLNLSILPASLQGCLLFNVILTRDGIVMQCAHKDPSHALATSRYHSSFLSIYGHPGQGFFEVWAKNRREALRIASTLRKQAIRGGKWPKITQAKIDKYNADHIGTEDSTLSSRSEDLEDLDNKDEQ